MKLFLKLLKELGLNSEEVSNVTISGKDPVMPSPFLIGETGAAVIAAVGYLVSELWFLKNKERQKISVKVKEAAIVQRSHAYLKVINKETEKLWAPISGFYKTKDQRWIQLHCNFPNHQQGVMAVLECEDSKDSVAKAVQNWVALELEETLSNKGLCAAVVRSPKEWQASAQAKATESLPLIEIIKVADSKPEPLPAGRYPLSGIKALDLTRVIAGPVCGKTLAEYGARVMRIASPELPFIEPLVIDTGFGKLSAYLNIDKPEEKNKLFELIKQTDIFTQAYRPGGLASRGFSAEALAELRPGIVYVTLSAYSHVGPWANRHGYDSLVQSATGIVHEQSGGGKIQHMPTQTLDYLTGFLAAIGTMEALRRRALYGGSYLVRVSLLQTANWFKKLGRVHGDFSQCHIPTSEEISNLLTCSKTPFGEVEHLLPVLQLSETPPFYSSPAVPLGTNLPEDF